jgi:hypothetical protein
MENADKKKLYIITGSLDLGLLLMLFFYKFSNFDKIWISTVFITHGLFYYALTYYNKFILDILHIFVFILPALSVFTNNVIIKIVSLLLLLIIQFLWFTEKRCILNEPNENWGFGDELNIGVIFISFILSFNIVYNIIY